MVPYLMTASPVEIIHADETLVVVAKAPGTPTQPDQTGDSSVLTLVQELIGSRLWPVHRIDRPASGIVLCARTTAAAAELSAQLASGRMERRYWALVAATDLPDSGELADRLVHDRRLNKSFVRTEGKQSALHYWVRGRGERYSLLEIALRTGRHHQVRAQLAHQGWPVRGDVKYGARRTLPGGGICLHAVRISLTHPVTGERLTFTTRPPSDPLWDALSTGIQPADGPDNDAPTHR